MLAKRSMHAYLPNSFTLLFAGLLTLLTYLLPGPAMGGEGQILLALLAKVVAPLGTAATAFFTYRRWQTERRDKQHDKARIAKLEEEARELVSDRARKQAENSRLIQRLDEREIAHNERKRQRLDDVESELAALKQIVQALRQTR